MQTSMIMRTLAQLTSFVGLNVAIAAASAAIPPAPAPVAGPVAIVGGKLLTISHGVIEKGTIVLIDGKIAAIGSAGTVKVPQGAKVIDASGMTVYPGLVDAETNLGLVEIGSDQMTTDTAEPSDEIMPHMQVYDAFPAETTRIPIARLNGITTAVVAPAARDSIAGQDMFIQLDGKDRDEMILQRDIALAVNFTPAQRRITGGRGGGGSYPMTRMGLITQLRQAFNDALEYKAKKEAAGKKPGPAFKVDLRYEALLPYLAGEKPVIAGIIDAQDLEPFMQVAQEFHLKVILNHLSHAQDDLDKIAAYRVPVIFSSIWELPDADERFDAVYSMPGEMAKRGIKVAIATDNMQKDRNLPYAAGFAAAYGMPYDEALKSITLNPAEMLGMGDKYGSLDVGKVANVIIANGDPLDARTDVKQVFIDGKAMEMVSRQTILRDEYSK